MFLPLPHDRLAERIRALHRRPASFGLGISMFLAADLGLAPWDIFHQGLSEKTGIPIGIIIEITGVFILLLWIPLRERMGLGHRAQRDRDRPGGVPRGDHLPRTDLLVLRVPLHAGRVCWPSPSGRASTSAPASARAHATG